MPVSFVDIGSQISSATSVSGTCGAPPSSAVDDLFVLVASYRSGTGTSSITVPPGYTLRGALDQADTISEQHLRVYTKVADAGDVSGGAAVSITALSGCFARITGCRGVVYIGDIVTGAVTESATTTVPFPIPPTGEGKILAIGSGRFSGAGINTGALGDYAHRYSGASASNGNGQWVADADYDTGIVPDPPEWSPATITKLNVSLILSGTPLPTPNGRVLGLGRGTRGFAAA
jgi:hypothetical protein